MLTEFESSEAKALRYAIDNSVFDFVLNPTITKDIARLEYLENHCDHKFQNGVCVYCGKENN